MRIVGRCRAGQFGRCPGPAVTVEERRPVAPTDVVQQIGGGARIPQVPVAIPALDARQRQVDCLHIELETLWTLQVNARAYGECHRLGRIHPVRGIRGERYDASRLEQTRVAV